MDRFLEDQEGRDRSSSPNVQCGITDKKCATQTTTTTTPTATATTENNTQQKPSTQDA